MPLHSLFFCFLPPSSLILPHPPLFSSILMSGLGGLTCLVIDGNVSGSHFPRQHPAAFHQAWCRGEPITWMLLTLCLLCPGFSDPSISHCILALPWELPQLNHLLLPPTQNRIVDKGNCFQLDANITLWKSKAIWKHNYHVAPSSWFWEWISTNPLLTVPTTSITAIRTWFQCEECFAMHWNC